MKKIFLVIILLALSKALNAQISNSQVQGIAFGYYNDKFGSHGMRAGYETAVWQNFRGDNESASLRHAFILKANINFYNHRRHHKGLSLNISIGYRYTSKGGIIIEPLHIGTGYMHSFLNGKTYQSNKDEEFNQVRFAGNSSFIMPYLQLIGLGYDLRQKTNLPLSFMVSLDPYFQYSFNAERKLRLATPITMTYFVK